jgi:Flp pilus assembly protein TadB
VNVKKQALTTTEIEMLALATLAELDERRRPASGDSGTHFSQPKTGERARLHWFIDIVAIAGCAMAGVYLGAWLDSPEFDSSSVDTDATE